VNQSVYFVLTFVIDHKYLNWKCTGIAIEEVTYLVSKIDPYLNL